MFAPRGKCDGCHHPGLDVGFLSTARAAARSTCLGDVIWKKRKKHCAQKAGSRILTTFMKSMEVSLPVLQPITSVLVTNINCPNAMYLSECDAKAGPQRGQCAAIKCPSLPEGCSHVKKFEKLANHDCCPKLCYAEDSKGKQCMCKTISVKSVWLRVIGYVTFSVCSS